jgi:hypothetical protein
MPSDDRGRSFENALASHVRASHAAGAPGNPCADSEMLAAYHEGSLPPEQIASLKTHVTACTRCQEVLAFLEATDQIPFAVADVSARVPRAAVAAAKASVRVLQARKPTSWRWIAPAGALAAALLAWVAVQENHSLRIAKEGSRGDLTQTQIAKAQPAAPPPLARPSLDATEKSEAPSPDAFSASDAVSPSQIASDLRQRSRPLAKEKDSLNARKEATPGASVGGVIGGLASTAPKSATPPASDEGLQPQAPRSVTQTVTVEATSPDVSKTDAFSSALAQAESETKSANAKRAAVSSRSTPSAPTVAGAAPAPAPEPSSEPSQLNTESAALQNLPTQQRNVTNLTSLNQTAGLRLASGGVGVVTVSAPGGRVSWRIGQAGVIEFSSNAGKTWTVQPSGIIADLLAGSAPSPKVCWIVGRSGTILRTTDGGKHWQKVNPPTQDDLRSVFAVNARQATVSLPNASYLTTDGGATWNKLPPE